jgi:selenide,water dikinase
VKRLILAGGGHSHAEVLRRCGRARLPDTEIVLVSPGRHTAYSGMLPGLVAGHYAYRDIHLDLEALARRAGARFVQNAVRAVDAAARRLELADGVTLHYDLLSLDVGSVADANAVPGAAEFVLPVRPVESFLQRWEAVVLRTQSGAIRKIAVVGGGAGGVELLLAIQHRLRQSGMAAGLRCSMITDTTEVPAGHNARVQAVFRRVLRERNVDWHAGARVTGVEPAAILLEGGGRIACDAAFWTTGPAAPPWLRDSGLALDAAGFVLVTEHLQSISAPEVFAAGDCATVRGRPYPRSGVYAVRQGPPLARNLRAALTGAPLARYVPQARALALISAGDRCAVASYGSWAAAGRWVWRWKDTIDRRFMARYRGL